MAGSSGSMKTEPISPKPDQKSPRARNTLNQRQSRARRKTYISELECKIRWFESAGVQATREVQVAAQQVVEDNRRLRWILQQRFGVDEREVSLLLSSQSQSFSAYGGPAARSSNNKCPRCGFGGLLEDPRHSFQNNQQPQLPSPPYIEPDQQRMGFDQQQQPLRPQPDTTHTSCRPPPTTNSMPCEEAAAIIASMRGGDAQDVWPELGCSSNPRCNVDNVQVMSLMDEDLRR